MKIQYHYKVSLLLCIYGVFKEFRPAEPYIVPIMTGPPLNLTAEQINHEIFPVSSYSTVALLIIVFLVTDFLRYKIVIILQTICMIVAFILLIYGRGTFQMKIEEVFYGAHTAGEVAYFTYIYAKVDKKYFQEVTSHTRSAFLLGRCLSGIVSQIIVSSSNTSLASLLWITVCSQTVAVVLAILLPSVDKSMYFHRNITGKDEGLRSTNTGKTRHDCKTVVGLMWNDFLTAFTNLYVLKWALWWALATCCCAMCYAYSQVLWKVIRVEGKATNIQYNGVVETVYTFLGALSSMAVGKVDIDWQRHGEAMLALGSLIIASLLYVMSETDSEIMAYTTFIIFAIAFQIMITVAVSEVAKNINRDSYGLVFGITTFAVYVVRCVFTYIALQVLRLKIRVQFEVYSTYFAILGVFFAVVVLVRCFLSRSC